MRALQLCSGATALRTLPRLRQWPLESDLPDVDEQYHLSARARIVVCVNPCSSAVAQQQGCAGLLNLGDEERQSILGPGRAMAIEILSRVVDRVERSKEPDIFSSLLTGFGVKDVVTLQK